MEKDFSSKLFSQPRTLPAINNTVVDIPAQALVQITGESGGLFTICRPAQDSLTGIVGITGSCPIKAGKAGHISFGGPLTVVWGGVVPVVGEIRGTSENSFYLTAGKSGFKVLAVNGTRCCVREVGANLVFFNDGTRVDADNPDTVYYATPAWNVFAQTTLTSTAEGIIAVLKLENPVKFWQERLKNLLTFSAVMDEPGFDFCPTSYTLNSILYSNVITEDFDITTLTYNGLLALDSVQVGTTENSLALTREAQTPASLSGTTIVEDVHCISMGSAVFGYGMFFYFNPPDLTGWYTETVSQTLAFDNTRTTSHKVNRCHVVPKEFFD